VAQRSGLSESTIGRIWRTFELKPHRTDTFKLSTDPLFVEKVYDVVFLQKIDAQVPDELDVHFVSDNYRRHKSPAIRRWLDAHPRFHVHYTPTDSSWINQVERWFAYLTDDLLRRSDHRSVQALEKDIRSWVAGWNENPTPFIWTKSAEQIPESLSRLLQRITGGGH
jgi:transposase